MNIKAEKSRKSVTGSVRRVSGVATKPRLSVFRSNADIYVQLIDDNEGVTLASASSKDKDIAAQKGTKI